MNKDNNFSSIAIIVALNLFIVTGLSANWIRSQNNIQSFSQNRNTPKTHLNQKTQNFKSDSLPEGFTQDWLKGLHDENGNRIIQETAPETSRGIPEDPAGDAVQRKILNGFNAGDSYGVSVSSAGDVNGDGFSDVIVGAYGYSTFTGRAYIYYGGTIMNTNPDVIMTGEAINNYFGHSVSSAGDVNGDGYSDVIVGADGYSSFSGKSYVFFGGAGMNNVADVTMTGTAGILFGASVSTAGDVNGDGYSDVIIGAFGYSSFTGRAYIFFGGVSMNNVVDVTMTGEAVNNYCGGSVSLAGDVNGDGYSDVIVGAFGYSSNTGRAYVIFGGEVMNNIADVIMTGVAGNDRFGASVSGAGDVNGDGYSDVIVGANQYSSNTGRVYVFLGGSGMNSAADVTMTGEAANNYFGQSVSGAGDVNGDGYSDVIVGAYGYSGNTGRVYVFFGGADMNNAADVTITGEVSGSNFGYTVFSAGDVNNDGYSDLIVGAYGFSSNTGRAYIYDYFMRFEITSDVTITGEVTGNKFGYSVSSAGDVNGDGYSDIIVGAYGYSSFTGRAYIFFGGAALDNVADVTMTGEVTGGSFGYSVSSAGDVNSDGYSDVIVGAFQYSSSTGRAYIFFGGVGMNNVADLTMTGEVIFGEFGNIVSDAGDVNGDGYSDVIVGAFGYSSYTGRAYVFFGGANMNNSADVIMTGEAAGVRFGRPVSAAGDVNGDGYSDVIIGAFAYSSNTGRAYVFFGGAGMNNAADVTMTGEAANDAFGWTVSEAGDVNGDGYSDVIVGASGNSGNTGKAYIFFGGTGMNNVYDVTMTGETATLNFGWSVSEAGDMNGDGYSDVIIGAYVYSSFTGRAYVFYGGAAMNNNADVIMTGEATNNDFGYLVSSAGDVNGDGYSDVIVGANGYSSSTGRAYTYLGSAISAKPILNYVKDVPNDQGGFVDLKWARSSYDVNGTNLITHYVVERSAPPVGGNFAWVNVADIPSNTNSFYSYLAATPFDSSSNSNGSFFFRITAKTSIASQYWRSGILSGRSIDNIAPLMVSPFVAAAVVNDVRLSWKRSTASDLLNYILYRSTSPTIDPETEPVFANTSDSTYLDTSPLSGVYYYFIVAQDIHNNKSPVAITESPNMTLNLIMFIEGFYNAGSNSQVSDTITVELRNSTSPFAVADQSTAVVSANGTAQLKFGNASNRNYYIAVKHRNSIETWSSNAIALSQTTPVNFDLSSALLQAFGSNMSHVDASPERFALYSGDVNLDGIIDASDLSQVENDAANSLSGYVNSDITGDDFVDADDLSLVENNTAASVSAVTP